MLNSGNGLNENFDDEEPSTQPDGKRNARKLFIRKHRVSPKFAQVLKWVGYVDGALIAGAADFASRVPQYQSQVLIITSALAGLTVASGVLAHKLYGSQTVPGNPLENTETK